MSFCLHPHAGTPTSSCVGPLKQAGENISCFVTKPQLLGCRCTPATKHAFSVNHQRQRLPSQSCVYDESPKKGLCFLQKGPHTLRQNCTVSLGVSAAPTPVSREPCEECGGTWYKLCQHGHLSLPAACTVSHPCSRPPPDVLSFLTARLGAFPPGSHHWLPRMIPV